MSKRGFKRIALVSFALLAPLAAFLLAGERFLRVSTDRSDLRTDAVVVMAGSSAEDRQRTVAAVELIHSGKARYLIFPMRNPIFTWPWVNRTYRLQSTIPSDRVLIGLRSDADSVDLTAFGGTYVEARKTVELMKSHQLTSAVVVSSAYHTRRSQLAFEQVQKDAPFTFFYHPIEPGDPLWWIHPQKVRRILREYQKLIAALLLYPSR